MNHAASALTFDPDLDIAAAARHAAHAPARPAAPVPRVDLYAPIHKALRMWLSSTLVRLGRIDVADATDRAEALEQLEALLEVCESHIRHENEFVHAAIEARQPAGSQRIAAEHVEHAESIATLREEAAALRTAGNAEAERVALRLYRHLALFVAENFEHMHVEETAHNAMLWQHYGDDELMALHGRLMAAIPRSEHFAMARWLLPANTPFERSLMVGGMAAQMPPEALLGVLASVRPHLDESGWSKLAGAHGIDPNVFG